MSRVAPGTPRMSSRGKHPDGTEDSVEKRLVTRYAMQSRDAADENQRRVEAVFAELSETRPDTVS